MIFAAILFIISRLIFWGNPNIFFDSAEYISRWSDPNLLNAVISGHPPLHMGYVIWFYPIFKTFAGFMDPLKILIFLQILMGWMTIYWFFKTTVNLFNQKIAFWASTFAALMPVFIITNLTVMMETTYLFLFFGSLYYLSSYLKDNSKVETLWISSILWVFGFLTHTVLILWIPLFLVIPLIYNKKKFVAVVLAGIITLAIASFINAWLLGVSFRTNTLNGFYWLYAAKFGEHAHFSPDLLTIYRYFRNWLFPIYYNLTSPLSIAGLLGLSYLWLKDKRWALIMSLWILPSFIANQWWDSLLYGRHGLIAYFGLCLAAAYLLKGYWRFILALIISLISFMPLRLLLDKVPYQEMASLMSKLPPGGLMIDSHFARPYTDGWYFGQQIYVDEPGTSVEIILKTAEKYLLANRPVFVTGHALSEPYGLFSGPFLHPITLSYKNEFLLKDWLKTYDFARYREIREGENLMIFRIVAGPGKVYPVKTLSKNQRRLDSFDPIYLLWSITGGRNLKP